MNRLAGALACLAACLLAATSAAAPACGTIVIPLRETTSFHPLLNAASAGNAFMSFQLYPLMLWFTDDGAIDWANAEASAIDVSPDRTTFTLTLKPWRWSDGQPVTADDIVYCFELIRALGPEYPSAGLGGMPDLVRSITADGPLQLTVRLSRPVNIGWFELNGLSQLVALPRHAWGAIPLAEQAHRVNDPAFFSVVDGPFRLADTVTERYVALSPNPSWRGPVDPALKRLVIRFLVGADPVAALRTGELDVATVPDALLAMASRLPGVRIVALPNIPLAASILYNFANPSVAFFHDLRVRQAIAYAIDQNRLIATAFHGRSHTVPGPLPASMAAFLSPAARADPIPYRYDPAKSLALLAAAGFTRGADGIMQRRGVRLEWSDLLPIGPTDVLEEQIVQADLAAIGIRMNIDQREKNQAYEIVESHPMQWQTTSMGALFGPYPALDAMFASGAPYNWGRLSDPITDRYAARLDSEPGPDALDALQDRLAVEQPALFLPHGWESLLVADGVTGVRDALGETVGWRLDALRLTGSRVCPPA